MTPLTRRTLIAGGLTLLGAGTLTACAAPNPATSPAAGTGTQGTGTAITHVHALTRDPESGEVLLATHQGLFRLRSSPWKWCNDLQGMRVRPGSAVESRIVV